MEYKKLLPAIVALLVTTSFVSILTPAVANHSMTVSVTPVLVRANYTKVFTVTVTNAGPDPIDNVILTVPGTWSGLAALATVPEDNVVKCDTDNEVNLPAGTVVRLVTAENVKLVENTDVIRENNTYVLAGGDNWLLQENAVVEVRQNTDTLENLLANDNIKVLAEKILTLTGDNRLMLLEDTQVVRIDNVVKLPENTRVGVYLTDNATGYNAGDNIKVNVERRVTLLDNRLRIVNRVPAKWRGTGSGLYLDPGENIELMVDNNVIIQVGTVVQLLTAATVAIPENTEVIRENGKLLDVTGATVENQPAGWAQTVTATTITWLTDNVDRMIKSSKDFLFAITSPAVGGDYTFEVTTDDNNPGSANYIRTAQFTITVDNVVPTIVSISVSPDPAKDNTAVTITVTASEQLAKLENVMAAENQAPENTQVTMTSTDNIVWTGTYTTGDNIKRDGTAKVYVLGTRYEDPAGNTGTDNSKTFTVDRVKPPTPSTTYGGLTLSLTSPTNQTSLTVSGTTVDNRLYGGIIENVAGMRVKIRVGTSVEEVTSGADNRFSRTVTLSEGNNEIGVKFVDKAGNESENENVQKIFVDSKKPVITPVRISGTSYADNMIVRDNTPTIELTIVDEGYAENKAMGVENSDYAALTNSGFVVQLRYDNDAPIATLVNSLAWDKSTGGFENSYPTALADGSYKVNIKAGDNLQSSDNKILRFEIDTTAPGAPTLTATASQNPAAPDLKMTTSVALGGTCEAGATVKIWTSPEPFTVETVATSVVDTDGDGIWTAAITISQGVTTKISVSQVDTAGNESSKRLYGYLMVDASAPTVVITLPATGTKTDKASITVSGTVTKDTWEIWSDITLRVQVGLTGTTVPISAGTFSVDVALAEGSNTIIATATDPRGWSSSAIVTVERTVTPWGTYAIILVIVALILAAIAIFRKR